MLGFWEAGNNPGNWSSVGSGQVANSGDVLSGGVICGGNSEITSGGCASSSGATTFLSGGKLTPESSIDPGGAVSGVWTADFGLLAQYAAAQFTSASDGHGSPLSSDPAAGAATAVLAVSVANHLHA